MKMMFLGFLILFNLPLQADNNVRVNVNSLKAGDIIYIRPLYAMADTTFLTPEEVATRNQLTQYEQSEVYSAKLKENPIRSTIVRMTWKEYETALEDYARRNNLPFTSVEERTKAAAKMYQMTGLRPLRHGQVLVTLPNLFERIYDVKDIGFTKDAHTTFFDIGEKVIFPTTMKKVIVYLEGRVVAIKPNGEIIVERGLHTEILQPEDLFSKERTYRHPRFQLNEDIIYDFKATDRLRMDEHAKVVGISPTGDVAVYLKKTNQILKLTSENAYTQNTAIRAKACPMFFSI